MSAPDASGLRSVGIRLRLICRRPKGRINLVPNTGERRIDELRAKLADGDTLIVAELSRLGRNMFETLNIINTLGEGGVRILFVRQPELSTDGRAGYLSHPPVISRLKKVDQTELFRYASAS